MASIASLDAPASQSRASCVPDKQEWNTDSWWQLGTHWSEFGKLCCLEAVSCAASFCSTPHEPCYQCDDVMKAHL